MLISNNGIFNDFSSGSLHAFLFWKFENLKNYEYLASAEFHSSYTKWVYTKYVRDIRVHGAGVGQSDLTDSCTEYDLVFFLSAGKFLLTQYEPQITMRF